MPKSVLFICCDQFLYSALGYAGHPLVKTPNLDCLAAQSVNFPLTFTASPVCVPARRSLFSGKYPHKTGQLNECCSVTHREHMLHNVLKDQGYHTGAIGKLHFVPFEDVHQFDTLRLHDGVGDDSAYTQYLRENAPEYADLDKHGLPVEGEKNLIYGMDIHSGETCPSIIYGESQIPLEYDYTTWMVRETESFLRNQDKETPFFLFVSFVGPHSPYFVPEPYFSMYDWESIPAPETFEEDLSNNPESQRRHQNLWGSKVMTSEQIRKITALYYGHITLIDTQVGLMLEALAAQGLDEDTMIVFSADHGELLGNHGMMYKMNMYEESNRIPLLIKTPGITPVKNEIDELVSQTDIMPSILDWCEVGIPDWVQGKSLFPLIKCEQKSLRDEVFSEISYGDESNDPYIIGCRTKDWLFTLEQSSRKSQEGELYDLKIDPDQINNLFSDPAQQEIISDFKNRTLQWLMETT